MTNIALYIATHNKTGLKYFGKSKRYLSEEDLQKHYHGSGKYWKRHLNKHGDDVTMSLYGVFSENVITEVALKFSEEHNIVESNEWANFKLENGLDGGTSECSKETREKISKANLGKLGPNKGKTFSDEWKANMKKPKSEEHKQKISEIQAKNYNENYELKYKLQNWIKENGHPRIGMTHSEESKQKISESTKGRKHSKEVNMSKGRPGKIWVYNEELKITKMIYEKDISPEWTIGRKKFK